MASKIIRHIPNAITCCNLLCGSAATLLAFGSRLTGEYQKALLLIVAGAVFDFFDGLTARALHVSGPMGKELDSLADVVTFGLAPATMCVSLLAECASLHGVTTEVCAVPLIMVAFSALRHRFPSDHLIHRSSHPSQRPLLGRPHRGQPRRVGSQSLGLVGAHGALLDLRCSVSG